MKIGMNVLDVGCADGLLAQVLYVNRLRPNYVGVDIRLNMLEKADKRKYHKELEFVCMDVTSEKLPVMDGWADIVVCFELVEHIPPINLSFVLHELRRCLKDNGVLLLSTPNYDGVHQAANHLKEYYKLELESILVDHGFSKMKFYGTFASQKDLIPGMTESDRDLFTQLHAYYDSNVLSVILAPLYPSLSRNILWELRK